MALDTEKPTGALNSLLFGVNFVNEGKNTAETDGECEQGRVELAQCG